MKKTILAIVILSLLLSVCSCASSNSKEIESLNQKISELEKQQGGTETAVSDIIATDVTNIPESSASISESAVVVETETSANNDLEQYAAVMENYEVLDVANFEGLFRDERLPYSQYLIDQTLSSGMYDQLYGEGKTGQSYAFEYTPVSPDNTGLEIIDNYTLTIQISLAQSLGGNNFDPIKGQKILSSAFYEVGDPATIPSSESLSNLYLYYKDAESNLSKVGTLSAENEVTNTSELLHGTDNDGNKVDYKIITYHDITQNKDSYARFYYHEFTNYDGKEAAVWLLDIQELSLEKLES